jgi:hypothetical protein
MRSQAFSNARTATIASGATDSGAMQYSAYRSGGFQMPAAFTGTAVSFKVSADGVTYTVLKQAGGTPVSMPVSVSEAYPLPAELEPWPWFKFVSDATEGAARNIAVVTKS